MEKKPVGAHAAERKNNGLLPALLGLAAVFAVCLMLVSTASQLQESRRSGGLLLGDKLALERALRETDAALAAQQAETARLEAEQSDLEARLAGLQGDLTAAGLREAGLMADLEDAQLQETILKDRLELTQQELAELTAQCGSVLRPTPDVIHYQSLYPDLYVPAPESQSIAQDKVVYLTFDDGPSAITDQILKTLDKYGIKATFFVVPDGSAASNARLRAIVEAGHSIGIHTASHVYTSIYKSVEAYLQDFELAFRRVEQATGVRCDMFRFPGGSVNAYNRTIYQQITAEMLRRGFTYYDWNASGDDSAGQTKADGITQRALETTTAQRAILLLHDNGGKDTTAKALPTIIDKLLDRGYRFDKLDSSVLPPTFTYKY